jgi:hypothetical protein
MKSIFTIIFVLAFMYTKGQAITNMPLNTPAIGVNALADRFTYDGKPVGHYALSWNQDSWYLHGPTAYLSAFGGLKFLANGQVAMSIQATGNVGIGTTNPASKLTVAGEIAAREVKVTVNAGADFVFNEDYQLRSLSELGSFIKANNHLPDIASANEMEREGVNLSEMNIKLLQKIEELTLYIIQLESKVQTIDTKVSSLINK